MTTWSNRIRHCLLAGVAVTVLAAGTASAAGAATTASAPTVVQPCASNDVAQQVRSDRYRYRVGQTVKLTVVAWNRSGHDCAPPPTVRVTVSDASGATVFGSAVGILWIPEFRWRPGHALTWTFTWDTHSATPGRYTATGSWDDFPPASTSFVIGAAR